MPNEQKDGMTAFLVHLLPAYGQWLEKEQQKPQHKLRIVHSHIYAIHARGTRLFKIGYTTDPEHRFTEMQVSLPFTIEIIGLWIVPSQTVERQVQQHFKAKRKRGEWFTLKDDDVQALFTFMEEYQRVK